MSFPLVLLLLSVKVFATNSLPQSSVASPEKHARELDSIFERKVLRVAMYNRDTPPFYYQDENGQLAGVDIELIQGFARELGIGIEFDRSATSLNEVVDMVSSGQADIGICKLSITFERAARVLFTQPYIKLRKGLLVNRILLEQQLGDKTKREAIQKLQGTLGVIGNSSYVTYAKQRFQHMAIKEYDSWPDVVQAVLNREVIAGFRDEAEIKKVTLDNKQYAMELLTVVLEEDYDPKGIALQSDAQFLKALLDFYIESLGLELSANRVLFDYDSVVSQIHRYKISGQQSAEGEQK